MLDIQHNPQTLDELYGISHIRNSLKSVRLGIPTLLTGERGLGKTTIAHILAKDFGASDSNIQDVNCGYYRKIEDTRGLIDNLSKTSFFGKKKVLILDEVHQLTTPAQNAWLRPLDPDNLDPDIFVLACTTTLEPLIDTFLRRFKLQYKVYPLSDSDSKKFILKLCKIYSIKISKSTLQLIIDESLGIPGLIINALNVIAGVEDEDEVKYLLEIAKLGEDEDLLDFVKYLISPKTSWNQVRNKLKSLYKKKKQPSEIRYGIMNIISGRLMSDFFKDGKEGNSLIKLHSLLKQANGVTEKSNLTFALYSFKKEK